MLIRFDVIGLLESSEVVGHVLFQVKSKPGDACKDVIESRSECIDNAI